MKKIIIILLAILCLCACTQTQVPSDADISSSDSSSEENAPEEVVTEPEPEEEIDPVEQAAIAEIRGMWLDEELSEWKKEGFSASPGNIVFFDGNIFSYTFNIEKDNYIISFPALGTLAYNNMENFSPENHYHILASWGCEGTLGNGIRYFISLGKILFLDSDFEMVGQIFLPENNYYHMWPISVAYSEEMGYIVPVCKIPKDGTKPSGIGLLYSFDENFELDEEMGEIPVSYSHFGECYIPHFSTDSYIYYFDDVPYLSSALEYNLDSNTAFLLGEGKSEFYDGERSVEFIEAKPYAFEEESAVPYKSYALLKEGNDVANYIELEESYWFGSERYSSWAAIAKNGNKAEVFDDFFHRVFSLNFRKKTVEYEYVFKEEDLGKAFDTTEDKKYSLHATSIIEAGDAAGFNVVLKNNETGEMYFMFPSSPHQGFFKNGDIYHQSSDFLRVYSSETRELLFALEDKFPLNADSEKGDYRIISAFRRDPETLEFMIVYLEGTSDISLYQSGEEELPVYKIAFLDAEGNVKETYESEIPAAIGMYMWPQDAVIYYKNDKYTITTLGDKNGDNGINFTFDYNEKTFSKAKKNK